MQTVNEDVNVNPESRVGLVKATVKLKLKLKQLTHCYITVQRYIYCEHKLYVMTKIKCCEVCAHGLFIHLSLSIGFSEGWSLSQLP